MLDRSQSVRCASIKCLCEMIKHTTFLFSSPSSAGTHHSSQNAPVASVTSVSLHRESAAISHELDSNVKLAFKSLGDTSTTTSATTYDVRCAVGIYLAQLVFYAIGQIQLQQLHLQQQLQMANAAAAMASGSQSNRNFFLRIFSTKNNKKNI